METNNLGNINIKEDSAVLTVNTKIYPMDVIHSAAYIMIDEAFIILDGDPDSKISVEIRKKKAEQDIMKLVQDFNNELLNYAVYKKQSEKNKQLREAIIQRVLLTSNTHQVIHPAVVKDTEKIMKKWDENDKD